MEFITGGLCCNKPQIRSPRPYQWKTNMRIEVLHSSDLRVWMQIHLLVLFHEHTRGPYIIAKSLLRVTMPFHSLFTRKANLLLSVNIVHKVLVARLLTNLDTSKEH